jgi:hypothetical protein
MTKSNKSGKGDWYRPVDHDKYEENYTRIFGEQPLRNVWRPDMKRKIQLLNEAIDSVEQLKEVCRDFNIEKMLRFNIQHVEARLYRLMAELKGEEHNGV